MYTVRIVYNKTQMDPYIVIKRKCSYDEGRFTAKLYMTNDPVNNNSRYRWVLNKLSHIKNGPQETYFLEVLKAFGMVKVQKGPNGNKKWYTVETDQSLDDLRILNQKWKKWMRELNPQLSLW